MNNAGQDRELMTVFDAKYVRQQVSLIMVGTLVLVVPSVLFGGVSFIRAVLSVAGIAAGLYALFVAYTFVRLKPRIRVKGNGEHATVSARKLGDWSDLGPARDVTLIRAERSLGADRVHLETSDGLWKSGIRIGSYMFTEDDYKKFAKKWPGRKG